MHVSTFNRFPIWFLQERERRKKGGRACVMLKSHRKKGEKKVVWLATGDQRRCCGRSRPSQEGGEEKRGENKRTPSQFGHWEQRLTEREERAEQATLLHPAFVPLPRHTYFQSPGKSVDSSLFPLLGLLAGYPFQQTWWLKRVVTITDSSTYSFTKTRSVWLISDQELDIKWCCLTAAPLKTNQAF